MKIIDLLNKIANYEETPVKIKFKGNEYEWSYEFFDYKCININHKFLIEDLETEDLNRTCEEIPLIEENKKCKKLSILTYSDLIDMTLEELVDVIKEQRFKINEIIDVINRGD